MFGFLILPISRHQFLLQAIEMLFYARTKDEKVFLNQPDEIIESSRSNIKDQTEEKVLNEIKRHKVIRVSNTDSIKLFFTEHVGCCYRGTYW